jgi:hypothetical protein
MSCADIVSQLNLNTTLNITDACASGTAGEASGLIIASAIIGIIFAYYQFTVVAAIPVPDPKDPKQQQILQTLVNEGNGNKEGDNQEVEALAGNFAGKTTQVENHHYESLQEVYEVRCAKMSLVRR